MRYTLKFNSITIGTKGKIAIGLTAYGIGLKMYSTQAGGTLTEHRRYHTVLLRARLRFPVLCTDSFARFHY
jgi:hypothetical protein